MLRYLSPAVDQVVSSTSTSSSFVVPSYVGGPALTAVSVGGTLVKNGVSTGLTSISVIPTDVLSLLVTSPSSYGLTSWSTIGINNLDIWAYSVTTSISPIKYVKPEFSNVGALDNLYVSDPSKPAARPNAVSVVSPIDGVIITSIDIVTPVEPLPLTGGDYLVVADYYSDRIIFFDKEQRLLLNTLSLEYDSRPSSCALFHDSSSSLDYVWVTLSGTNKLIKIDTQTLSVVQTIDVSTRPINVTVSLIDNSVWVTLEESNQVVKYTSAGVVIFTSTVSKGPTDAALDDAGNLWVVCSKSNVVSRIDGITGSVQTVAVGKNPWGIKISSGYAYVTNSYDGTLTTIETWGAFTVDTTVAICSLPGEILVDRSNNLWVASFGDQTVTKIVNGIVVQTVSVDNIPLSLSLDLDDNIWVCQMYSGTSARTYLNDLSVNRISFNSVVNATKGTSYTSNSVTISGIREGFSVPCSIPQVFGFNIIKNGISVGASTTVVNGDQVQLQQTADNSTGNSVQQSVLFSYGRRKAEFLVTTLAAPGTPDLITFNDVVNAVHNTSYTSNAVTVSGILTGSITIAVTTGHLVINGVVQQTVTSVVNGDQVQWVVTATSDVNSNIMTFGPYTITWTIYAERSNGIAVKDYTVISNKIERISRLAIKDSRLFHLLLPTPIISGSNAFYRTSILATPLLPGKAHTEKHTTSTIRDTAVVATFSKLPTGVIRTVVNALNIDTSPHFTSFVTAHLHEYTFGTVRSTFNSVLKGISNLTPLKLQNRSQLVLVETTFSWAPQSLQKEFSQIAVRSSQPKEITYNASAAAKELLVTRTVAPSYSKYELTTVENKVSWEWSTLVERTVTPTYVQLGATSTALVVPLVVKPVNALPALLQPHAVRSLTNISTHNTQAVKSTQSNQTVQRTAIRSTYSVAVMDTYPVRATITSSYTALTPVKEEYSTKLFSYGQHVVHTIARTYVLHYVKEVAVIKGDKGLGLPNISRTHRFATPDLAVADGVYWKFTSITPVAWGDGTYIWTGNCSSYRPFKFAGYISGG